MVKKMQNELLKTPRQGGWSDERRAAHAAAMRRWKPWERSTGPRTAAGKARAARNALKHGLHTKLMRRARRLLRRQAHFVRAVRATLIHWKRHGLPETPRGPLETMLWRSFRPQSPPSRCAGGGELSGIKKPRAAQEKIITAEAQRTQRYKFSAFSAPLRLKTN